jgi:sugar lactone lactonase YvrE
MPRFPIASRLPYSDHFFTLLTLLIGIFLFPKALAVPLPINGDINGDGRVNVTDAVLLLRASVHLTSLSPEQLPQSDLNGDGSLTVLDALVLLKALSNSIPLPGVAASPPSTPPTTAHFHVDIPSGSVWLTGNASSPNQAQAIFGGSRILFNFTTLVDEGGDIGRKVLSVSLKNTSNEPMGISPNGRVSGIKLIFSGFSNTLSDLRTHVQVSTLAGTGAAGSADGAASSASFGGPGSVTRSSDGTLYVTDYANHTIRKIQGGQVSTLAGSGLAGSSDGGGHVASFNNPAGIVLNPMDGSLVVAERTGNKLRRVTTDGAVTTIAGTGAAGGTNGAGNVSSFAGPWGVAVDADGTIYVAEFDGHRVRKVVLTGSDPRLASSYTVSTLAGSGAVGTADGTGTGASFNSPIGVATSGGVVYVAEYGSHRVRRIAKTGEVTVVAGTGVSGTTDGAGNIAQFKNPGGITVVNGALVVSEAARLRQITLKVGGSPSQSNSWKVGTSAGTGLTGFTDGRGDAAQFASPFGMGSDEGGSVYLADFGNKRVRKVTLDGGYFRLGEPAGSPPSEAVQLSNGEGMIGFNNGVSDLALPYLTYLGELESGKTSDPKRWAFKVPSGVSAFEFTVTAEAATITESAPPTDLNVGSSDVWVRTYAGGIGTGFIDGPVLTARFNGINAGLAIDGDGDFYFADSDNDSIRRISAEGDVSTIAGVIGSGADSNGKDGLGTEAKFYDPEGIAVTPDGKIVFVTDFNNHTIRRLELIGSNPKDPAQWSVTTIAGLAGSVGSTLTALNDSVTGDKARFNHPIGLTLVGENTLYVTELSGHRVRRLQYRGGDPALANNWWVSLVAGAIDGSTGTTNATYYNARFGDLWGITADRAGNLYVADFGNHMVRKITDPGATGGSTVSTLAGSTSGRLDGNGTDAKIDYPSGLAVDSAGYVYITDWDNNSIRRISPGGVVTTVAGTDIPGGKDGPGNSATFNLPTAITVDNTGSIYVVDGGGGLDGVKGSRVRLIQRILR